MERMCLDNILNLNCWVTCVSLLRWVSYLFCVPVLLEHIATSGVVLWEWVQAMQARAGLMVSW